MFNRFYIPKCLVSMFVARCDISIIFKPSTISHQQGSGDLSNHVSNMRRHLSLVRVQSISSVSIVFDGRSNSSAKSVQHFETSSEYRHNSLSLGLQYWCPMYLYSTVYENYNLQTAEIISNVKLYIHHCSRFVNVMSLICTSQPGYTCSDNTLHTWPLYQVYDHCDKARSILPMICGTCDYINNITRYVST